MGPEQNLERAAGPVAGGSTQIPLNLPSQLLWGRQRRKWPLSKRFSAYWASLERVWEEQWPVLANLCNNVFIGWGGFSEGWPCALLDRGQTSV